MTDHTAPPSSPARRKPRNLALEVVEGLGNRIRDGRLGPGDKLPTETAIMAEFGVSRTVVREAISKLQAGGQVQTRHGIGTFVLGLGDAPGFKIAPDQLATLRDVIAVLELRIGLETEAAALAAVRRSEGNLHAMRLALDTVWQAMQAGQDAVAADFQFHLEIARATQNGHFAELMSTLGSSIIPRARLHEEPAPAANAGTNAPAGTPAGGPPGEPSGDETQARQQYLRRVHAEHESILDAVTAQDPEAARAAMRTHLANSRERRRRAESNVKAG